MQLYICLLHLACFVCAESLHTHSSSNIINNEASNLVIVRTHVPKPGMLTRMHEYAADLAKHMPDARFVISIDTTDLNTDVASVRKMMPTTANIHTYTWNDVNKSFPQLPHRANAGQWNVEPLSEAVAYASQTLKFDPDFIWAFEDDVILCGSISKMITAYNMNNVDYLASSDTKSVGSGKNSWADTCSPAFDLRFPYSERYTASMWVERFSNTFFDRLKSLSLSGISAQSEMFPSTIAKSENFTRSALKHMGEAAWDDSIDENEAAVLCAKLPKDEVTINHAGKWKRSGA